MALLDDYEPTAARSLPVVLLLDTSGSMHEDDKIAVLNDSVSEMVEELTDLDAGHGSITLSIVTFGGDSAQVIAAHRPIAEIDFTPLAAGGRTPMGDAFRLARELIEDHDALPARAFRPTLALVSDGIPTNANWEPELQNLLASDRGEKSARFALAVGADADRDLLARFTGGQVHEANEAAQIRNFLQFVTITITQATLSIFDPDTAKVSDESMLRLQRDDAF